MYHYHYKNNLGLFYYQTNSFRRRFFLKKKQKYLYLLFRFFSRIFFEFNHVLISKSFLIFFINIFMRQGNKTYCLNAINQFLIFYKKFQKKDPLEIFYLWGFYNSISAQLFKYKLGQYRKAKVIEFLHQHMGSGKLSSWFHFFKRNIKFGHKNFFFILCHYFFSSLYFKDSSNLIQARNEYIKRLVFGINYLYTSKFLGYKVNRIPWKKRKSLKFFYKKSYNFNFFKLLLFINLFQYYINKNKIQVIRYNFRLI